MISGFAYYLNSMLHYNGLSDIIIGKSFISPIAIVIEFF